MSYPKRVRDLLDRYGNDVIESIEIRRNPISSFLDKALNVLSFGSWADLKKKYGYDQFFHLFLVISLKTGKKFLLEKNQTINLSESIPKEAQGDLDIVPIPNDLTLNTMLERTRKRMGDDKYFIYDPFKQNCQDFVLNFLIANNLSNTDRANFIKQDVEELSKGLGIVPALGRKITDLAGWLDYYRQEIGLKAGGFPRRRRTFGRY